jgi:hypothetical protein
MTRHPGGAVSIASTIPSSASVSVVPAVMGTIEPIMLPIVASFQAPVPPRVLTTQRPVQRYREGEVSAAVNETLFRG